MRRHKVSVLCHYCDEYFDVDYFPGEAMVTGGPSDRWYPGDPPEADIPAECPHCYHELDEDDEARMQEEAEEAYGERWEE